MGNLVNLYIVINKIFWTKVYIFKVRWKGWIIRISLKRGEYNLFKD